MAVVVVLGAVTAVSPLPAKVFMTQDEALKVAFPSGTDIERATAFLTEDQSGSVEKILGEPLDSKIITYYVGRRDGTVRATAYFDTHVVRTLPETIMVVVDENAKIERIDVLSFSEPEEYLPRKRWIAQLDGRGLDDDMSLRGEIRPMTGASLSARAIVKAARRILALHGVLTASSAGQEETVP